MKLLSTNMLAGGIAVIAMTIAAVPVMPNETIQLGIMNPLTGTYAFGGVPIQDGMKLAIKHANDAGVLGNTKIIYVEADTAGDKGQTITLVSKFAQSDNVLMILGPTTSLDSTGGAHVANQLGVKKVSLVFDRSNDGFVGQKDAFKKFLQDAGVTIVSEEGILPADTD